MDWDRWAQRWQDAVAACERLGGHTVRLRIGPPATTRAMEDVERELGSPVPRDLRAVLLGFSGEVEVFWFLPDQVRPPSPFSGVSYGECLWSLADLPVINREVAWLAENVFTEDESDHRLWANAIAFQSIGNGDFLAIDATVADPQPVVYLSHEEGWGHGLMLGSGFRDFLERWTRLGCPSDDVFPLFVTAGGGGLDITSERARLWCAWLGLPDPTAADESVA